MPSARFSMTWSIFFFRETRDGRHVVALDIYPGLRARTLNFLGSSQSNESISMPFPNGTQWS